MGARTSGRAELDADVVAAATADLHDYFPGPPRPPHHPRLGRPDRRLPDPPPGGPHPRPRPRLGRRRLHRQRRRPQQHGRPHPRLPRPRTATTSTPDLAFVDAKTPRVPPEPFHWIGGEAIRLGILKKEQAELEGRQPGRLASAVAKVPELIGFHIGR